MLFYSKIVLIYLTKYVKYAIILIIPTKGEEMDSVLWSANAQLEKMLNQTDDPYVMQDGNRWPSVIESEDHAEIPDPEEFIFPDE